MTKINKEELQKIIDDLENEYHFFSRVDLFRSIEATEWAKGISLTAQVARLHCINLNINIKTPFGKSGRPIGVSNRDISKKLGISSKIVKESLKSLQVGEFEEFQIKKSVQDKDIDILVGTEVGRMKIIKEVSSTRYL